MKALKYLKCIEEKMRRVNTTNLIRSFYVTNSVQLTWTST